MGTFELTVNGQPVTARVDDDSTLLRFLREDLHLTGTKEGCSQGDCWACTVLVDGLIARACQVKVADVAGASIETIEGLATDGQLHPLQQAFIECGAVQCGFCTPGLIMHAKNLLGRNPSVYSGEIRAVLDRHICRCASYLSITEAVKRAGTIIRKVSKYDDGNPLRGKSFGETVIRGPVLDKTVDVERVSGLLKYSDDIYLEGMLQGKILFAGLPHAEILSLDTGQASNMAGVRAVLTGKDVPELKGVGAHRADGPVLSAEKVLETGDVVAVVFADTYKQAEEAVERVQVSYRALPVVDSPEQGLRANASLTHEAGNLLQHSTVRKGNVARGFAASDVVVEGRYETQLAQRASLEREVVVAQPDSGGVVLYRPGEIPAASHETIARKLGLPVEKVKVVSMPSGGPPGGRADVTLELLAALGALRTGRPVKIKLSRAESLRVGGKLRPYTMDYKIGASRDGKLLALQAKIFADLGARGGLGAAILRHSVLSAGGHYRWPNAHVDGYAPATNNPSGAALRGFNAAQVNFALESTLDILARKLKLDPIDLRLRNGLDTGGRMLSGEKVTNGAAFKATLRQARKVLKELPPVESNMRLGVGIASGFLAPEPGWGFGESNDDAGEGRNEGEASGPGRASGTDGYVYVTQVAVVRVDERSGDAKLRRIISCHQFGKVHDPRQAKAQLEGAVMMGMGYAMSEQLLLDKGTIAAAADREGHGFPTFRQTPHVFLRVIEEADLEGAYDIQSACQVASVPTAAAVANAIYDAVGVRMPALPATKEKIFAGLKRRGGSPI